MEKIELKDAKKKKIEHKLLAQEVLKTMAYSFLTGLCMAAGGHAYASISRQQKGKLISINGGKQSTAI